jgi:hypothetical protein
MPKSSNTRAPGIFWRSGLSTAGYLGLGVPLILIGAIGLTDRLPLGHSRVQATPVIAAVILLAGLGLVGALWCRTLARQTGVPHARRLAWVGGLAFGPLTVGAMLALAQAERLFVEMRLLPDAPMHVIFAILFTLAAFMVSAGMALGVGWAARGWSTPAASRADGLDRKPKMAA